MSNRARSDGRVTDLSLPFGGPVVYGAAGGSEGVIGPGDNIRARARVALGGRGLSFAGLPGATKPVNEWWQETIFE